MMMMRYWARRKASRILVGALPAIFLSSCQTAPVAFVTDRSASVMPSIPIEQTVMDSSGKKFDYPAEKTEPEPQAGFDRIAAIHLGGEEPTPQFDWMNKRQRQEFIATQIRKAAKRGAKLILLPEAAFSLSEPPDEKNAMTTFVERVPGTTTRFFGRLARELKVYLHVPVFEIEPSTQRYFISVAVIDPTGECLGTSRKMGLSKNEKKLFIPGKHPLTYESPWGKVAVLSASDLSIAGVVKALQKSDVKIFAVSGGSELPASLSDAPLEKWIRLGQEKKATLVIADSQARIGTGVFDRTGTAQSYHREISGIAYGYVERGVTTRAPASSLSAPSGKALR